MAEETIESLKQELDLEKKKVRALEQLLTLYEANGPAKLYYSINRKLVEMADMLNSKNLKTLDIEDPKDKTFERLKVIWNDGASLATAVQSLGNAIGITGDEEKDTSSKRRITTPETISDVLGNRAGQHD